MARHKKSVGSSRIARVKVPVSPSVRGTGEQSARERKGTKRPSIHHGEGSGHPPGGGRGGKLHR